MVRQRIVDSDDENITPSSSRHSRRAEYDEENDAFHAPAPKRAKVGAEGRPVKRDGQRHITSPNTEGYENRDVESFSQDPPPQHDEEDDVDEDEDVVAPPPPKILTQPRDVDGYVPGSIVRIKLHNFLTYDDVEFSPGPYMNMILGPNGTGKSSIACAICIGLGFPLSVLGRATDLPDFVKKGGGSTAFVEIELKGSAKQRNIVIRRDFNKKDSKSQFHMDGRVCTMKEVGAAARALNVQVQNLCSFLPQDKVSHFARLSPRELLEQTQLAAGEPHLSEWHGKLIKLSKDLKEAKDSHEDFAKQLEHHSARLEALRNRMEKWNERQKIIQEIEVWEIALPFAEYEAARAEVERLKFEKRKATAKVNELQGQNQPLDRLKTDLEKRRKELAVEKKKRDDENRKTVAALDQLVKKIDAKAQAGEKLHKELEIIEKEEKKRRDAITQLQKNIENLKRLIAAPLPVEEDGATIEKVEEWLKPVRSEIQRLQNEMDQVEIEARGISEVKARWEGAKIDSERRLQALGNATLQRIEGLKRWDPSAGYVSEWLLRNQHQFKEEVFLPLCVCGEVPNQQYQAPVEAFLNSTQLKIFVCQNNDDFRKLNEIANDQQQIKRPDGRDVKINVWFRPRSQLQPPPFPRERLPQLGLDCYASDQIKCPDGMRWFLEKECNLHRYAIGLREAAVNIQQSMDLINQSGAPSRFVTGRTMNDVSRSKYGQRLPFMNTYLINAAKNLKHQGVDPNLKKSLDEARRSAVENVQRQQALLEEQIARKTAIQEEHGEHKKKSEQLQRRLMNMKKAVQDNKGLEIKLKSTQNKLDTALNAPAEEERRQKAKKELLRNGVDRAQLLQEYKKKFFNSLRDHRVHSETSLKLVQADANIAKITDLYGRLNLKLIQAQNAREEAARNVEVAKEESLRRHQIMKTAAQQAGQEAIARFQEYPKEKRAQWTIEFIEDQLDKLRIRLEDNPVEPGIVQQWNIAEKAVREYEEKEAQTQGRVVAKEKNIKSYHDRWYPALKYLVDCVGKNFSDAFDRLGCAGEVRIHEDEADYAKWEIQILVKFREDAKLTQLTAQRQSGGERSLATILYLMSLTEYARAPFSLVDEINQGMDQRAERAVHDQLVEATCTGDSGQYFLITPKLLPDLRYHPRMRILCVNNGEWLPDDHQIGNLGSLVDGYINARRAKGH